VLTQWCATVGEFTLKNINVPGEARHPLAVFRGARAVAALNDRAILFGTAGDVQL
jgi:hypothetical protein